MKIERRKTPRYDEGMAFLDIAMKIGLFLVVLASFIVWCLS